MKTYCFKLYHAKRNKKLHKLINIAGIIYNHCIALHKRYYRLFGKSLNVYALQKHLTKLKKLEKYSHWKLLGSQAIQDITQRIDKGYKLFFRNQKHNRAVGQCIIFRHGAWYFLVVFCFLNQYFEGEQGLGRDLVAGSYRKR